MMMLENNSVEYSYRDIFTPATVADIAELKENSVTEDSFLLSYFQEDSSFVNDDIFDNDDELNYMSAQDIQDIIDQYEQQFGMTSDELLKKKMLGTAPDLFEIMDWLILLDFR